MTLAAKIAAALQAIDTLVADTSVPWREKSVAIREAADKFDSAESLAEFLTWFPEDEE